MKTRTSNIALLVLLLMAMTAFTCRASAAALALKIAVQTTNTVRMDWNSTAGSTYQLLSTPEIDPFSLWTVASNSISASGTNTTAFAGSTNARQFFKLHTVGLAGSGLPTAKVVSHTNGQTVFGLIKLAASAQDDSRLSAVTLLIDGVEQDEQITEGPLEWILNTGHFANGPHTIAVRALDNAGIGYLGGSGGANLTANATVSSGVTLNFSNLVRWFQPVTSFDTFVPISMRAGVSPTNWTVFVEAENGQIVRSFAGSTPDGIVETDWDGNDDNGLPVPGDAAYRVLFTLGSVFPPDARASIPSGGGGPPPPPLLPAADLPPVGPPTWNDKLVWRELPWQSGEIILARQQFLGGFGVFNTVAAANMATLKTDIETAATADERLSARTVYSSSVIVCNNNASYDTLLNDLKQINVRDFYYIGHSSGNAIGYSEGAPGNGITTDRLRLALRNFFVTNVARWQGRRLLTMRKPFRFAFIDGCLSAQCGFYGALGILADNDHTRLGKKRRSSLGWTTSVKDSIINNNQANWSARFWKEWVDTATDDYDISLQVAANRASVAIPLPMNPLVWGYRHLTWAE